MFKTFARFIYWFFLKKSNFSQSDEEVVLNEIFSDLNHGFYVDVGCHHPMRFSNTAKLYKKGWRGINIDADPSNMRLFKLFRKRDINLNFFISNKEKEIDYHIFNESALNGNISKERIKTLQDNGYKLKKTKKVQSISLNKILETYKEKFNEIDLLDIDVEGHDLEVLKSIDLDRFNVNLILIEVENNNESEIDTYLKKYGYKSYILVDRNKFYIKN